MTIVEPTLTVRPRVVRAFGIGLTAYGLVGIVLLAVTFLAAGSGIDRVERLTANLSGTLDLAATSARSSATALSNLESGVQQGVSGARDASRLADQASVTSQQLAAAMSVSIFGTQPLLPMATSFQQLAGQLDSLSTNLDGIGTALNTSGRDLGDVQTQVSLLASRLESITGPSGAVSVIGGGGLRLTFMALLVWLAIPALGSLLVGIALLTAVRRVPPTVVVSTPPSAQTLVSPARGDDRRDR
jgi:hypothetical protein